MFIVEPFYENITFIRLLAHSPDWLCHFINLNNISDLANAFFHIIILVIGLVSVTALMHSK